MQISISNAIKGQTSSGGGSSFENLYSFEFDGATDYIQSSTSPYSELDGQTKATFSLWVKPQLNQYGILFHVPRNTTSAQGQVLFDLTQSASQDRSRVFINGVNQTAVSNLTTRTQFSPSTGSLLIGEETRGYLTPFLGNMDEFAIWSGQDLRNDVATIYNGGVPNDLNDNGLTAPTTWYRMGENATWTGREWNPISDVQGSNDAVSATMPEAARTTDVPT
jgi:hypothetical protein